MVTANAAKRLIQHYVDNFRRLPWRSPPGEPAPDPYRVWLSEIMLQQTTVAAVTPRFEWFVARWPTIEALAGARDEDVLQEWAGLGDYARARNLIACARAVGGRGGFPGTAAELRLLPGIGDYTAGAIAAIAFGEATPAVDTNVTRVIARLNGLEQPDRLEIQGLMSDMMPADRPGDFVQALMDLGATICRPRAPRCESCPLSDDCRARATRKPEAFPVRRPRVPRPVKHGIAWWIERNGHIWLVRRPTRGMLGGMAALPGTEWTGDSQIASTAHATLRHIFTHFELELQVVRKAEAVGEGWWQPLDRLDQAGLPTLYRKAAAAITDSQQRRAA
jgi:A/G-specific adenine glycosylase